MEIRVQVDSVREPPRVDVIDGDTVIDIAGCVSEVKYRLRPNEPGELTLTIPFAILDVQTESVRAVILKLSEEWAAAHKPVPPQKSIGDAPCATE